MRCEYCGQYPSCKCYLKGWMMVPMPSLEGVKCHQCGKPAWKYWAPDGMDLNRAGNYMTPRCKACITRYRIEKTIIDLRSLKELLDDD